MKSLWVAFVWVVALLLLPMVLFADTITVCPSGCDAATVGEAVAVAAAWDTVIIHPGTFIQSGYVVLDNPITIRGSGPGVTILEQGGYGSVFYISSTHPAGSIVKIEDLTILNGDSSPSGSGGAINVDGGASTVMVEIRNCVLEANVSGYGGAVSLGSSSSASMIIDSTLIRNNEAWTVGGAVRFRGDTLTIKNSAIIGNDAWYTGGVFMDWGSTLVMTNTTVASNTSQNAYGAGVDSYGSDLDISFSTFVDNFAPAGYAAGVQNEVGNVVLTASILSNPGGSNCTGTITSGGYNIDDDSTCGLSSTGDISGQSPELDAFVDTGDYKSHYPLLVGSIARDHAAPLSFPPFDQRHISRPQDGDNDGTQTSDSGAIEMEEGPFFEDGFETGTTSGWSAIVP